MEDFSIEGCHAYHQANSILTIKSEASDPAFMVPFNRDAKLIQSTTIARLEPRPLALQEVTEVTEPSCRYREEHLRTPVFRVHASTLTKFEQS